MSVLEFSGIRKIGDPVLRKEDGRFLLGKGRYTDDIVLKDQAFIVFVRSPHAHALIHRIDPSPALASEDVVAVYTGADLLADGIGALPPIWQITSKDGSVMAEPPRYAMTAHTARHVGDIVALVVANSPSTARWAAEQVIVDYDPLPAVVVTGNALDADAPAVHADVPGNLCFDWELGNREATDAALARADHVVTIDLVNTRIVANPMEPRSAVAEYDPIAETYTLYTSSQNPHIVRSQLCQSVLHIPEQRMRVVAPDVGGGFGVKCYVYPEEALIAWAAQKSRRPVKWTADRSETFLSDAHARDHVTTASLALDKEGHFLALKVSTVANLGAYLSTWGPSIPTYLYAPNLAGQYVTPAIYAEVKGVFTHTLPVDAYRGAGRPEASYVIERLVDIAAHDLGFDRAELRRRNFVPPTAMPYPTPVGMVYDSGNFEKCFDTALRMIDFDRFPQRRAESEARGKLRGLGFSCYIESCGLSPSRGLGSRGSRIALYESGQVRLNPDGSVTVFTGTHSHGQGHETVFAQIISQRLGVPMEEIEIVHGDTARIAYGLGTYGSRSAAVGGSAIVVAAGKVIDKGKKIAGHFLDADPKEVSFENGMFTVAASNRSMSLKEVAREAYLPIFGYPTDELEPGLDELAFYDPKNFTFPNGTQICELEVDPRTGEIAIMRHIASDDFGVVLNPMIVEGQLHGGLVQGIGQALLEHCVYDPESGQLLTGTFMDYAMPRASDVPSFETEYHEETPCTHNPLGVKGCGEAGTIGAAAAVMNAVMDALAPFDIRHMDMPASPQRVWRAVREAGGVKAGGSEA